MYRLYDISEIYSQTFNIFFYHNFLNNLLIIKLKLYRNISFFILADIEFFF